MRKTTLQESPRAPPGFAAKRSELQRRIAHRLLAAGVAQIPLRELAAQLGTSDRMLLYYFKDKDDLVRASLDAVSAILATLLETSVGAGRASPTTILERAVLLFASPGIAPFMTVWSDISARGSRGEQPFHEMARTSVLSWLNWLEQRLRMKESDRRDTAVAILTILEGARMLETALPGSTKKAIATLARTLSAAAR